jgi:hypothetical protein
MENENWEVTTVLTVHRRKQIYANKYEILKAEKFLENYNLKWALEETEKYEQSYVYA